MHFDFTVSIGQVVLFITLIGAIIRFELFVGWFLVEHEMLIQDYIERHPEMRHFIILRPRSFGRRKRYGKQPDE